MTFVISKLFWGIAAPGNLLVLLLVWGLVWQWRSRRRRGQGIVVLATLALFAIIALPAGEWLVAPLEERFPVPVLPERVDGIVVLGGGIETRTSRTSEVHLNDSADRVVEAAVLARRYPEAKLLASGGDGNLIPEGGEQEADLTRDLLIALGVAPERILAEDRSRNTIENATYSRDMAQPKPGEVWLLVTSAWHMPRAAGCFRHVGFEVLPYPVDFRTAANKDWLFLLSRHLALLDIAAKEWVGLVSYRLLGRIDSIFPAPQAPDSASTRR